MLEDSPIGQSSIRAVLSLGSYVVNIIFTLLGGPQISMPRIFFHVKPLN